MPEFHGGQGFSWFETTITNDRVSGGVGYPWFEVTITSERVGELIEDFGSGGARPIWGPIARPKRPFEASFKASVAVPGEISFAGAFSFVKDFSVTLAAQSSLAKNVEFSLSGLRKPAERWLRMLREDDELLLFTLDSR